MKSISPLGKTYHLAQTAILKFALATVAVVVVVAVIVAGVVVPYGIQVAQPVSAYAVCHGPKFARAASVL